MLNDNIRTVRENKGFTQEDIAKIVERIIDIRFPQTAGAGLGR